MTTSYNAVHEDLKPIAQLDRIIHEPLRLLIMTYLAQVERTNFTFLMDELKVTQGNLGAHISKLEAAEYIVVEKSFVNKKPHTSFHLTRAGQTALDRYWRQVGAALAVVRAASQR